MSEQKESKGISGWQAIKNVAKGIVGAGYGLAANKYSDLKSKETQRDIAYAKKYMEREAGKEKEKSESPFGLSNEHTTYLFNTMIGLSANATEQDFDRTYELMAEQEQNPTKIVLNSFAYCIARKKKHPHSTGLEHMARAYNEAMQKISIDESLEMGGLEQRMNDQENTAAENIAKLKARIAEQEAQTTRNMQLAQNGANPADPNAQLELFPYQFSNQPQTSYKEKAKHLYETVKSKLANTGKKVESVITYLDNKQTAYLEDQKKERTKKDGKGKKKLDIPEEFITKVYLPMIMQQMSASEQNPIIQYFTDQGYSSQQAAFILMKLEAELSFYRARQGGQEPHGRTYNI